MPLNPTGNVIKTIKLLKTKTILTFTNGEKFELGNELASEANFVVGQTIEKSKLKKLKEIDELNNYLHIALDIIKKGLITEYKLSKKLMDKGASLDVSKKVIRILKQNDLLNDEGYIMDYVEYGHELLYGENKIKQKLYEQGISNDRLNKLKFNQSNELKKAKEVVTLLLKCNQRYSYEVKKQRIYRSLLCKGYNKEIAIKAISTIPLDKDDKLANNELKTAIKAFINANNGKYDNDMDIFKALVNKLKQKGYSYNKIKNAWEEEFNGIID